MSSSPDLRILHFNDVYHINPTTREPTGGAARFVTVVNEYRDKQKYADQVDLVTFFSGDAFNPSIESSVTKGRHMVPFLRDAIKVDVACLGNHDFDFGVDQMMYLVQQCRFPWLIGNVFDQGRPLGNGLQMYLLTASNGIKIGLMGLVEKCAVSEERSDRREWLDTINSLPPDLEFVTPAEMAKKLVPKLREQGAEIIVALTHMREPNDVLLAESVPEGLIDIILGGHDHYYNLQTVNGIPILRSGSDFQQLSYIEARRKNKGGWTFSIERRDITSSIPEDPITKDIVTGLSGSLQKKLQKPIGYSSVDLDARFSTVRTEESNYGSLICDLMRFYYHTDIALMAGGTMRGDTIYPAGVLKLGDIIHCFPFEDPCVVIRTSGNGILAALENSVSKLPALEGRFCQVSGLEFGYDPTREPGDRVRYVNIQGDPLHLDKRYTIATRGYMARGKDGFDSLKIGNGDVEAIIDEEHGVLISIIMRQYFLSLKVISRWKRGSCVTDLFKGLRRHQVAQGALPPKTKEDGGESHESSDAEDDLAEAEYTSPVKEKLDPEEVARLFELKQRVVKRWAVLANLGKNIRRNGAANVGVDWCRGVRPQVEGRINIVS